MDHNLKGRIAHLLKIALQETTDQIVVVVLRKTEKPDKIATVESVEKLHSRSDFG